MSEEGDLEKTEPASERRLEQAREEGQVARSQELRSEEHTSELQSQR